jgi:hypothetical protein
MSLQKSSLQEKSNTIKKTKNLKIETDYIWFSIFRFSM